MYRIVSEGVCDDCGEVEALTGWADARIGAVSWALVFNMGV